MTSPDHSNETAVERGRRIQAEINDERVNQRVLTASGGRLPKISPDPQSTVPVEPLPLTPEGMLAIVREFADEDAFLCEFRGVTSINAPSIDRVIPLDAARVSQPVAATALAIHEATDNAGLPCDGNHDKGWGTCQQIASRLPETALNEDEIMRRLSSDNPKARHHREERADGWSSWRCIPIRDVIEVRAEALAALPVREDKPTGITSIDTETRHLREQEARR